MPKSAPLAVLTALAAALSAACAAPKPPPPPAPAAEAPRFAPPPAAPGIDPAIVKPSVSACQDFYEYACGGWIEKTQIPADQSRWVRSFNVIQEENRERLHAILEKAAGGAVDGEDRYGREVADLYAACLDEPAIEKAGLAPLQAAWRQVDGVKDGKTLAAALARIHLGAFAIADPFPVRRQPFFSIGAVVDRKDSTRVIGSVSQRAALSLPDRDYYLKDDEKSAALRKDFLAHVEKQLLAAGLPAGQARADAATVLALETELARSHWTRVDARDPEKTYHRLDLAGLEQAAPHFDWKGYLAGLGLAGATAFDVTTPKLVEALDAIVQRGQAAEWRALLRWRLLDQAATAGALPAALSDAAFWFQASHFSGAKVQPPRWKRCVDFVDGNLGQALGQAFVRRHFAGDAKEKALSLVRGVQAAMGREVAALPWMDAPTKARAEEKLAKVDNKIAYPDVWQPYDGVEVFRGDFYRSASSVGAFGLRYDLARIGRPVDRNRWGMTTPTVNAYYDGSMNEMVFPAGILQPPFYTQGANDAVNYGAIGFVVGHELTHGFDDQGRKFDAAGNLTDWWSPAIGKEFERRAACVVRQYDAYPVLPDVHLNGQLTLGENIADLGGLKLAFAAYQASRAGKLPEAPVGGFSADQQFFLAAAQVWCNQIRPENARLRAATDPHSSGRWRVNGPLSNLPEFARAFQCRAGDAMVRAERCEVW